MNALHVILPVLVGGLIGYCTNYIAIKMLFRPHKAVFIGRHRLPFTPGIIPKNQKRVARAVGEAVSDTLLTREDILDNLGEAGQKAISGIAASIRESDLTIAKALPSGVDSDEMIDSLSTSLAQSLIAKANEADLDAAFEKYGKDAINSLLGGNPMLGMLFNADLQKRLLSKLSGMARDFLNTRGEGIVRDFAASYLRELADKPFNELIPRQEDQDRLQQVLENTIRDVINKHGPDLLDQIDIQGIITQRIEAMDMDELEKLTMSVMKQELQAVINLGAVIGAVIGIVNIFL